MEDRAEQESLVGQQFEQVLDCDDDDDSAGATLAVVSSPPDSWRRTWLRRGVWWLAGLTVLAAVGAIALAASSPHQSAPSSSSSVSSCTAPATQTTWPNATHFVHFSDVHLNPFYNASVSKEERCFSDSPNPSQAPYTAPLGRPGCDVPATLMKASLEAILAQAEAADAQFLLYSGDSAAHSLGDNHTPSEGRTRALQSITDVSTAILSTFATHHRSVFMSLGNNDLPGDYVLPAANDSWYPTIGELWLPIITASPLVRLDTASFTSTFNAGGYYAAEVLASSSAPTRPTLRVLVLNTNLFSAKAPDTPQATTQLSWLTSQLLTASIHRQPVYIVGHIPPIVEPFNPSGAPWHLLWRPSHQLAYLSLVVAHSDSIRAHFFGHIHKDDIKLLHSFPDIIDPALALPLFTSPSLSPVYDNNPAFRVVSVDSTTLSPLDYSQHVFDLIRANQQQSAVDSTLWINEYSFHSTFQCSPFSNGSCVLQVASALDTLPRAWWAYQQHRAAELAPGADRQSRYAFSCLMRYPSVDGVVACAQGKIMYNNE